MGEILSNAGMLLLAALAVMGSPGPSTISLTAVAASHGMRASLPYGGGLVLGTIGVLLLVATGLAGLLQAWPQLAWPLRIAALLYCLFLAWQIVTAPPLQAGGEKSGGTPLQAGGGKNGAPPLQAGEAAIAESTAPRFISGLLLALANPKAYLAIAAVYSGASLLPLKPLADATLKCLLLSAMILLIHLGWLLLGAGLSRALQTPRLSRGLNIALALALLLSLALMF